MSRHLKNTLYSKGITYYFVVEFLFQIFYIEIIQHFLYFQVLETFKEYGSAIWEISQNLGLFGTPFSFLLLLQPNMRQEQFKAGRVEFTLEFKRTSSIEAVKAWQKNREASRQLLSTVRKQGACRSRTRPANKLQDLPPVIHVFQNS